MKRSILVLVFLLVVTHAWAACVVDSYSETNRSNDLTIGTSITRYAQSFTPTQSGNLTKAQFYLEQVLSPPSGNITVKLYTHTGTYGTSSKPGTLLATSDTVNITSLPTSFALIDFNFSGGQQFSLVTGTHYEISVEYSAADDYLDVGTDTSTPTHSGNSAFFDTGAWTADASTDLIFYVYVDCANVSVSRFFNSD